MHKNTKPKARRLAALIAALGVLVMSSGLALMVTAAPANAGNVGTNQPEYWETLPGEVCVKNDQSADAGAVVVPAAPEGRTWTKLIIKKGSGNIGQENQVFDNPVVGQGYTWVGNDPTKTGGWSHYILCSVPTPPTHDECDNLPGNQPEGTACSKEPLVTYGEWTDQAWECDDTTTTQTRTKSTTTYTWDGDSWEPNAPVTETETRTRQLTEAEITECPAPPTQIAVDIVFTEPSCANNNVASYTLTGDTEHVDVSSSTPAAPGANVTVTATAKTGFVFAGGLTEYSESNQFGQAQTPCDEVEPPTVVTPPAPTFVDPTCDVPTADVTYADVDGVTYAVVGEIAPGAEVEVTATPKEGFSFPEGATVSWTHTFDAAPTTCGEDVTPPGDDTATPGGEEETPGNTVVTPTVVHAGLAGADPRGAQGLALLVTGMALTVIAGGVAVRARN